MNIFSKSIITSILSTSLLVTNAAAESKYYAGIKGGVMSTGIVGLSDPTNLGIMIGYNVNQSLAIEGEFTTTTSDGDVTGSFGNWSVDTYALYAVGHWGEKAYLKAKAGILSEDISISGGFISAGGSDTGLSLGIGVGYHFNNKISAELEYTIIEEDIDFISLGVNYSF